MKKYKFLVPILLVVIFLLSIYTLTGSKNKKQDEYESLLATAKNYREQGILVDANEAYLEAYGRQKSFDLGLEIGNYYKETMQTRFIKDWGEALVADNPREPKAYEYLLDCYISERDYSECFKLADTFKKRGLQSAEFDRMLSEIEYEYDLAASFEDVGVFSNHLCPVFKRGKWGFASEKGGVPVKMKFEKVGYFSNDLAPVVDEDGSAYYIDSEGNKKFVVLNVNAVELGTMAGNVFALYNGQTWGYYNTKSEYLFGDYDIANPLGNGIAAVCKNNVWSAINMKGETVISGCDGIAVDEMGIALRNGRMFVYKDYSYTMYDENGNPAGGKFEDVRVFRDNTYAAVMINGKWGFIDNTGNMVIEPQYEDARSFSNGFAAVKMTGKWGYIDKNNHYIIEPAFEGAMDFSTRGTAFVNIKGEEWELLRLYKFNH